MTTRRASPAFGRPDRLRDPAVDGLVGAARAVLSAFEADRFGGRLQARQHSALIALDNSIHFFSAPASSFPPGRRPSGAISRPAEAGADEGARPAAAQTGAGA